MLNETESLATGTVSLPEILLSVGCTVDMLGILVFLVDGFDQNLKGQKRRTFSVQRQRSLCDLDHDLSLCSSAHLSLDCLDALVQGEL